MRYSLPIDISSTDGRFGVAKIKDECGHLTYEITEASDFDHAMRIYRARVELGENSATSVNVLVKIED